jgi:uncharacterized protein with HEPN domain
MARKFDAAIRHMREAIAQASELAASAAEVNLEREWRIRYALERALEIVSEASRSVPDELIDRHPEVNWRGLRDLGNVLRHRYDALAVSLLMTHVRVDLPQVLRALDAIEKDMKP